MKRHAFALGILTTATACGPAAVEDKDPDVVAPTDVATVGEYLLGQLDNAAQVEAGFDKLVERHVCTLPGRNVEPEVLWMYVEQVEVLPDGTRDAYYTRVNEISTVEGQPVTRIYKFAEGHPLSSNAFAFNGPRDGCTQPDVLEALTDADLVYRDGCDVTFVKDGDGYRASTATNTCVIPGGFINTDAFVMAEGLDSTDNFFDAATQSTQSLSTYEFRRIDP